MNNIDFDALARWAESDEPSISSAASIRRGTKESREEASKMLLEAAETPEEKKLIKSLGGRPALDPNGGASLLWRVRVPETLDTMFRAQADAEGLKFPELVRAAITEYLNNHTQRGGGSGAGVSASA